MKPIICITGTDGAGKTSITEALVARFANQGIQTEKVWSRFNNYFSLPILAMTRLSGHNYYETIGGQSFGFHDFEKLGPLRTVFALTQMIDVNIASYFKITRKRQPEKLLICERGPWDTLVDVIADTDLSELSQNQIGRMIVKQVHGCSRTFLISRDLERILPLRPDLSGDTKLEKRHKLYLELAEKYGWIVIDNNHQLKDAIETIYQELSKGAELW